MLKGRATCIVSVQRLVETTKNHLRQSSAARGVALVVFEVFANFVVNALIKDHASTGVAAKILQDFRNQAAAYQSSAKGESLSRFDMACGLGLATPDVERAVGRADTIRIVGALWMIRFKA